jgi:glycosyltransferase involved in cell wall biosynthesis
MKICFWGNIASALEGKTSGGGELQMALLAKALVKSGHEVVIIDVLSEKDFITEDGIKIFQIKGFKSGIKFIRFFTHHMPKLYSHLKAQKAEIYYCQIRGFEHILAFWAARKVNAKFVIQLASDLDAMGFKMRLKHDYLTRFEGVFWFFRVFLTELIFPILIRKADRVLVQHQRQKNTLLNKGINSIIFNNLIEMNEMPELSNPARKEFCYVGSIDKRKGSKEFFELAKRASSHSFKVIGQPRDKTGHSIYKKLKSLDNVILLGRLSHSETICQIANSKALISTSPMEGFPNVFLEAWACGIPVLSLYFDPGEIIEKEKLGEVTHGDIDRLIMVMDYNTYTDDFSIRSKAYVESNHILNTDKIKKIDLLFRELIQNQFSKII